MRIVLILIAAACCGCISIPKDLSKALKIQTKYTRQYVEATRSELQARELSGIGERLLDNCDKIDAMIEEHEK